MKAKYLILLLITSAYCVTSGCSLIYDYNNCPSDETFSVDNDWKYAPTASPEGMAYMFFPNDGNEPWRFDFPGRNGGNVNLPDGNYSVMTFNDDTSCILFSNYNNYANFTFHCRKGGLYDGLGGTIDNPLGPDTSAAGEDVEICPDTIWCCTTDYCSSHPDGVDIATDSTPSVDHINSRKLTLYPRLATACYTYTIHNVANLKGVAQMCASLSGMASSLRPSDMFRGGPVTLPVKAKATDSETISGNFLTYGLPSNPNAQNTLSLYVWLVDGKKYCFTFDVSQQISDAPDPLHVDIHISHLSLPEAGDPIGGSFDVDVDDWITIIINIQS